ncbi:MAG: TFIIB-type zinc ribbon-containing protein, partial [Candidatus Hodarchaeota archaeon]
MNRDPKGDVKPQNEQIDEESLLICPECGNKRLILDETTGDQVCRVCGTVAGERLVDEGPEWRAFSSEERDQRSRVGSPMSVTIH